MSKSREHLEEHEIMERLKQELREYEKNTPMTLAERKKVRKWVSNGNSVYECGLLWYCKTSHDMSYLDAMRFEEEMYNEIIEKRKGRKA